jgi:hypothetical protein
MKHLITWIVLIVFVAVVSGCATGGSPQPTVYAYPQNGQTAEQQSRDKAECQQWAQHQTGFNPKAEVAKGAGVGALLGALGGAAAGAAIGAATGSPGTGAAIGTAAGGIGGGVTGGAVKYGKSRAGYNRAFGACMKARNYTLG